MAVAAAPQSVSGAPHAWPASAVAVNRLAGLAPRAGAPHALTGAGLITADPDPELFGLDGKVGVHLTSTSDDLFAGSALTPGGKILASGFGVENGEEGTPQFISVTRRNPNGSPDRTFGGTGVVQVNGLQGEAVQVVPTADGGLVGAGFVIAGDQVDQVVFRLDVNGRPVPGFGQNGVVRFPTTVGQDFATNLVVQPDGKIVVVGSTARAADNNDLSVRRLLPNGALDPTFGTHGEFDVDVAGFDEATSVALQPDGKIVVVGDTSDSSSANDTLVIRLDRNGVMSRSFGNGGIVRLPAEGAGNVVLQKDGRIALVATVEAPGAPFDAAIFRLLANGGPDTSFNGTGQVVMANDGDDVGFGIGLEPDGSIVITAFQAQQLDTVTDSFLNRVTSSGKLDPRFGTNGTVRVHNAEATFEVGLSIQPDGKIVVAGRRGGKDVVNSIATIDRFDTDGSLDAAR
jgi:uncharacterized delta-60 repeat protein